MKYVIQDNRTITIQATPEAVFDHIEKMPNKFPVYKILETKPFLFLRLLFVDGFRSAMAAVRFEKADEEVILNIGDSYGPFILTRVEKPLTYRFALHSLFFNCRTGYSIQANSGETALHFDLVSERPSAMEKICWFFIKPFHIVFANKVLRNIRAAVERG